MKCGKDNDYDSVLKVAKEEGMGKMKGHTIEIRFGIIAVDKGFITAEQLFEALRTQVMGDIDQREHKLIGTILLEMGLVTNAQIDEVVKELLKKNKSETAGRP